MYDPNELLNQYPEVEALFHRNPVLRENLMRYYRFVSMIRFACENAKSIGPLPNSYFTMDQTRILDKQIFQDDYAAIIFVNDYINELGGLDDEEEDLNEVEDMNVEDIIEDSDPRIDKHFTLGLQRLKDCHVADMVLKSQEMLNDAINGALSVIDEESIPDGD